MSDIYSGPPKLGDSTNSILLKIWYWTFNIFKGGDFGGGTPSAAVGQVGVNDTTGGQTIWAARDNGRNVVITNTDDTNSIAISSGTPTYAGSYILLPLSSITVSARLTWKGICNSGLNAVTSFLGESN